MKQTRIKAAYGPCVQACAGMATTKLAVSGHHGYLTITAWCPEGELVLTCVANEMSCRPLRYGDGVQVDVLLGRERFCVMTVLEGTRVVDVTCPIGVRLSLELKTWLMATTEHLLGRVGDLAVAFRGP